MYRCLRGGWIWGTRWSYGGGGTENAQAVLDGNGKDGGADGMAKMMNVVHTSERVDVVRCGNCKHYDRRCFTCENDVLLIKIDDCGCHPPFRVDDDWFCADGERRDDDGTVS